MGLVSRPPCQPFLDLPRLAQPQLEHPIVIFKRKALPKIKIPLQIFVHVNEEGWMDENGVKLWREKAWCRWCGSLQQKPYLLVWDILSHIQQIKQRAY